LVILSSFVVRTSSFTQMLIFDQLNKADRHLRVLSWLVAAGMAVLMAGLWWIQVVRSRHYVEDERNQSYRTVRVPAPRGKVLDRNGVALAENRPTYNVNLYLEDRSWRESVQKEYKRLETAVRGSATVPRKLSFMDRLLSVFGRKAATTQPRRLTSAERQQLGRMARYSVTSNIVARLSAMLGQPLTLDEAKFHRHYNQSLALPLPILTSMTSTQVARLQEQALNLPGLDMEIQPTRVYPQGTLAAHVLGYLTRSDESAEDELAFYNYRLPDYRGLFGIEKTYDDDLRGRAGAKSVLVNNLGYRQTETILAPVEPGRNVTLTIDARIQRVAEEALANARGAATRPTRGAAVVLDVRTGEVIALASSPTFNPNDWLPYLPRAIWNTYTNEDAAPLQNRAIYGNFAPGSTFKIFVGLAGLEAGTLDPDDLVHVKENPREGGKGHYAVPGKIFRDTAPPGDYDFKRAFIKSSNGYFIEHGLRAGAERIVLMAERFGFGSRTDIALQESRGFLPTREWIRQNRGGWSPAAIGNLSIGQGELDVTPLQMAVAVAAVANGGRVLAPQLVLNVREVDELVPPNDNTLVVPSVRRDAQISRAHLDVVREAMVADTLDPDGTAFAAFHRGDKKTPLIPDYPVCGKTGTAQVFRNGSFHHWTVWFASYAPFNDPRYSVVVMVDGGSSGGGTCAPVAAEIYKALKYRDENPASRQPSLAIR
jgi:penicillin-binding protein 2